MNQLPVHLQNRQRRDLVGAALGGLNTGSPPHISIKDNRFTLVDDAGNKKPVQTLYLDVCVIDANASVSKIFFDPRVPYEPGEENSNPPICWSDNGIGASAQASSPQNTSCQLCPQNAWGSATSKATGKRTKACNDVKKLAVIVPGMDMVFLLRIPPASLKHLAKYTQTLAGHGVDLPDAVTRLEFESQGILKFTPMGYVDAQTAAATDKAISAKATDILIGRNDRPWVGGPSAEQQKLAYSETQKQRNATDETAIATGRQIETEMRAASQPMTPPPQPFGGQQAAPAAPFGAQAAGGQQVPTPFGQSPRPSDSSTIQNTAGHGGGATNASPSDPFGQAGTSSQTEPTPAKRTRGPNKVKADPPATTDDGIPPFLRRDPPQPVAPVANPTQFGMQAAPAAPDAGVQAALDAAFRLPT